MKVFLAILIAALMWVVNPADEAFAKSKLSKVEVQQIIIGKSWHNNRGAFVFRSNGTYQYDRHDGSYTWRGKYTLKDNGLIKGSKTNYRFYLKNDGSYQYYHSRSRRYFPVIFN